MSASSFSSAPAAAASPRATKQMKKPVTARPTVRPIVKAEIVSKVSPRRKRNTMCDPLFGVRSTVRPEERLV